MRVYTMCAPACVRTCVYGDCKFAVISLLLHGDVTSVVSLEYKSKQPVEPRCSHNVTA